MAVHDMLMAAGGVSTGEATYVDDVFSTYLYTGNGSTQTITNGIDLSTKGGLVWVKDRTSAYNHVLYDTERGSGTTKGLSSNDTAAQGTYSANQNLSSFNANGFSLGSTSSTNVMNANGDKFVSWTFREQSKFFDVVTYTGTGSAQTITHNLGSVPGCIIVKRTNAAGNWQVYHRGLTSAANSILLNSAAAQVSAPTVWNSTDPTSTVFSIGTDATVNASGATYVAYLFAHNAGGFGTTGADNVISCGSWDSDGTYKKIELGYEPQFLIIKRTDTSDNWKIIDDMRNWGAPPTSGNLANTLFADTNDAETGGALQIYKDATGFIAPDYGSGRNFIYIAIRRPMKPPTSGTEVFSPQYYSGTDVYPRDLTTNFPVDMTMFKDRLNVTGFTATNVFDRLRGASNARLQTTNTDAESSVRAGAFSIESNTAIRLLGENLNYSTATFANYNFKRAPGFFDQVCYTGDGTARSINHNLQAIPEMVIVKERVGIEGAGWFVYHKDRTGTNKVLLLNSNVAESNNTNAFPNSSNFSDTTFSVGTSTAVNSSSSSYVAYLFATLDGISKVGSYTGTGTTKQIDCGFTGGARFVMIKRRDSTGDWYVWDTARGIISGNDPYLLINTADAEYTNTDYIDPSSSGFEISSTAPAAINASGGSFIFLAIA